ncbi:MAG: (d)CMP kinase [Saprospirales bacterium]|nr:(d)CMP kinase [Saprospirales bacterium]MBK8492349.1 (d)CMP kinase [Saprospirales bacterium]
MKKIIIAIDGHSSCGKSTLARDLARELGYAYIDTGAMYRAVTLFFLEHQVDWNNPEAVREALNEIRIEFRVTEAGNQTVLNGEIVESTIRDMRVSDQVSQVSTVSAVRRAMVSQQQAMGHKRGVVLDGRDIGTVVFPDAELKIFLTASPEERVRRRFTELQAKGIAASEKQVRENLLERDRIDSTREDSPLKQAADARILDNTHLDRWQQLALALKWVREVQGI